MKRFFLLVVIVSIVNFPGISAGEPVSVKTMPPVVIKTFPQAGDTAVDPSIREIRVTFSKEMLTKEQWSFVQISNETFPKIAGTIHYLDDKRTCVLPVRLEPGKTYVIWINRGKFNYFKDKYKNPAVPYLLVFETE